MPFHSQSVMTPEDEEIADRPRSARRVALLLFGVVILFAVIFAVVLVQRIRHNRALARDTEALAVPNLTVISPKVQAASEELVLPGQLEAYIESPIYARVNGYILRWYHDIGSHVRQGEPLADIDTPDLDQQLSHAQASLRQVEASLALARISAERWQNLLKSDSVSRQEADVQQSNYEQAQANVAAARAGVRQIEEMETFKHVYAPFSGVITKRLIDIGSLINAGNGGTNHELFDLARVDPLRIYAAVPEANSPAIHAGVAAYITLVEMPGARFQGKVVRTANAIDPATRTLLTEVDIPNPNGRLLPGAYAQVHFALSNPQPSLTLPINALLFRADGLQAAVVGSDGRVQLRAVTPGRDYGSSIEVLGGVSAGDRVVLNPPDSLESGERVRVVSDNAAADVKAAGK
jgi:multidrug efflux system membrane fusion protein